MILTYEIVHELLDYNPRTGIVTWNRRDRSWFSTDHHWKTWNTRYAGKVAGSTDFEGYRQIQLLGKVYRLPRLIWFWMIGEWPRQEIDHKDRNKQNNRWRNLRDTTRAVNLENRVVPPQSSMRRQAAGTRMRANWLSGGPLRLALQERMRNKVRVG